MYNATILIADDSVVVRRMLSQTLRSAGYGVHVVADGREALDCLGQEQVDLLIADLLMPEIDGLSLVRQLRADEDYQRLPILMLTASGDDTDRIDANTEGVDRFLTKPASSHELLDVVSQLLGERVAL